jgi:phosphoadenosine phosphosulfate reductase
MPQANEVLIPDEIDSAAPERVLSWAVQAFHPRIALCTSFAAEGVVLIDLLARLGLPMRVFTLDTGRLMPETYAVMEAVRERYALDVEVFFPRTEAVEAMTRADGVNLFYRSVEARKRCCAVRKVEPLERALGGLAAWITGLRREQAETRTDVRKAEVDETHGGIVKVSPLADWTWADVWSYIRAHDVPYNALHDLGYPSIGCAPCTRAVAPGEDHRAGRWWWEDAHAAKECGLHSGGRRGAVPGAVSGQA